MRGSGVLLPLPVTRKFFIVFYNYVSFCARPRVEVTRPHRGDPVPSRSAFAERQWRPRILAVETKTSEPAIICEIKDFSSSHRRWKKENIANMSHPSPTLAFFPLTFHLKDNLIYCSNDEVIWKLAYSRKKRAFAKTMAHSRRDLLDDIFCCCLMKLVDRNSLCCALWGWLPDVVYSCA